MSGEQARRLKRNTRETGQKNRRYASDGASRRFERRKLDGSAQLSRRKRRGETVVEAISIVAPHSAMQSARRGVAARQPHSLAAMQAAEHGTLLRPAAIAANQQCKWHGEQRNNEKAGLNSLKHPWAMHLPIRHLQAVTTAAGHVNAAQAC